MAGRKRVISPEFHTDDKILELPITARLLFIGMWNFANDEGIFKDSPKQIKVTIFPADEEITLKFIENNIELMVKLGLLVKGINIDKSPLLKIKNWSIWQKINRPTPSKYIFTEGKITEDSVRDQGGVTEDSRPIEDKRIEVKGSKKKLKESSKKNLAKPKKEDFPFERFYELYPRKQSKEDAYKAYKGLTLKDLVELYKGLDRWIKFWEGNQTEKKFIPYPASWIRKKAWRDQHVPPVEEKEETKFASDLDKQIFNRHLNLVEQDKRTKNYLKNAGNNALDKVPDLLADFKKRKKADAQPIGDIVGQITAQVKADTSANE